MIGDNKTRRQTAINNKKAFTAWLKDNNIYIAMAGAPGIVLMMAGLCIMVLDFFMGQNGVLGGVLTLSGCVLLLIVLLLYELIISIEARRLKIKN